MNKCLNINFGCHWRDVFLDLGEDRLPALRGEPGQSGMRPELLGFGDGGCSCEVVHMAGGSLAAPGSRTAGGRDGFSGHEEVSGQMLSSGQGNCGKRIKIL